MKLQDVKDLVAIESVLSETAIFLQTLNKEDRKHGDVIARLIDKCSQGRADLYRILY